MAKPQVINSCAFQTTGLSCFEELTSEEQARIDVNMVEIHYKKGETICKQGAFASHIMVLREGLAKIHLDGNGETLILKILPSVNIIGLPFLFENNSQFQYSATAYLDSTVQLIEINVFKDILRTNAGFAFKIINLLSENTIITFGRFFCLTKKQTYGRMADLILCLSQRIYNQNNFPLHLNRKELAELAGMSVETTVRILTKFKADKLIKIVDNRVEILDFERLSLISGNG